MRLRFASSGQAPKAEIKEQSLETKKPVPETTGTASATNHETSIEAATGN
jgi:two-component system, NtrC family, nitrogen regulation sensor histidine kinase NtrY